MPSRLVGPAAVQRRPKLRSVRAGNAPACRLLSRTQTSRPELAIKTKIRSTTICAVRRDGKLAMAGDGQVTFDKFVMKHSARKVRRIAGGSVLCGFAGSAADGITLLEKFEAKLAEYKGNLLRGAVELAKDWRQDRALRRLEALLIVGNAEHLMVISGNGDVIEPDEGVAAIGSGGPFATAAAQALLHHTKLTARQVAEEAMTIAGKICIYTNDNVTYEELG